jgi:hypothetical protein
MTWSIFLSSKNFIDSDADKWREVAKLEMDNDTINGKCELVDLPAVEFAKDNWLWMGISHQAPCRWLH